MKQITTLLLVFATTISFAQDILLEPYASGFDDPIELKNAGDDRLFVVEQGGTIKIIDGSGTTLPTPFLDISGQVACCGERGLLGLAFHPNYATNGFFFVNYTVNVGGILTTQVSRFSVDPGDPNSALSGSELKIIDYEQPFSNHNGGCIAFGQDGYLYISSGDGGSGGDPGDRAQNTELLLGKLLRIDIDNTVGSTNYSIPADNPFAGDPSKAQEIWAYGLRNAWKFSFDSATDDLWIADVGQNAIEEINKAGASEDGLNYGWNCFEGSSPFAGAPTTCPPSSTLTFPVAEYPHSVGFSITGGYVYNGTLQPSLQGYYFFADFGTGVIGTVDSANNFNNLGTFGGNWSAFGVNNEDELFIVNYSGAISRIVEDKPIIGVDEFNTNDFKLYPNPAENEVNLLLSNDLLSSFAIMDMKGSVLLSESNISAANISINVAGLSQGIYLLKGTTDNNQTFVKKLVVK
ncbi:T9SS type A sorting domain-containing protein [Rasiella rasia]|uniref:T9SS type A sorting domain-containing protein n=1 Tax=Rasiella rasia TaxID=2744027 RepID=A0A6G6GQ35_9FLAO|nr:PQQ-dependent sugar dehydrogenase [Rasiella rasia]QIE60696.1 T9SS type A sorting domain-containing protein [Rasiella rasia]